MSEVTVAVPNAILFVVDPKNRDAEVPVYDIGKLVCATRSCVSVATISDVDGDVAVTLSPRSDSDLASDRLVVFSGTVQTPNRRIAVVTSQLQVLLETDVSGSECPISIAVDDSGAASVVDVRIG